MAGWLALAVPYIPEIIKIARPLFTRGNPQEKSAEVIAQQIAELQSAVIQNSESIKLLATEMQLTIEALQTGAAELEKKLERAGVLLFISTIISVLALGAAAYALAR